MGESGQTEVASSSRPPGVAAGASAPLLLLAAVVATIGAFLVRQVFDGDIWWHLAIGRDILARHVVSPVDHYAVVSSGHPYLNIPWLFQIVFSLADRLGGMIAVQALMLILWTLVFVLCYRLCRAWAAPEPALLLVFLAAMASAERFNPRPEIVTYLMVAWFLGRLQAGRYRTWLDLLLCAGMQCLWANSHLLFVLGPFLVGCSWLVAALRRLRTQDENFVPLSRLLAVDLLATLVTPWGITSYRHVIGMAGQAGEGASAVFKTVGEMSPVFSRDSLESMAFWFFLVLALAVVASILLAVSRRQRLAPDRLLMLIGLTAAALTGRRNLPLFALVAAPFLAEHLSGLWRSRSLQRRWLWGGAALAILALSWYPLSGRYYLMKMPTRFGLGATPFLFPYGLPTFLKSVRFDGQVLNSGWLGGFYLYHFYPQQLPLYDSRFEAYDQQRLASVQGAIRSAAQDRHSWQELVAYFDIRGILLGHVTPEARALLPFLPQDPQWRLVYFDKAASFWLRTDAANLPPPADISPSMAKNFTFVRGDEWGMLDLFLESLPGAEGLRLACMEQALAFNWQRETLLAGIGSLQLGLGRNRDAETTFRKMIVEFPGNRDGWRVLIELILARGDSMAAEQLARQAIAAFPQDEAFRLYLRKAQDGGLPPAVKGAP